MKVAAAFPYAPYGEEMARDWKDAGIDVDWEYVEPGPDLTGAAVADVFKNKAADILILDCIGYTFSIKKEASEILGIPVVQPKKLIADILATLFSE
jgi:protein AroM